VYGRTFAAATESLKRSLLELEKSSTPKQLVVCLQGQLINGKIVIILVK